MSNHETIELKCKHDGGVGLAPDGTYCGECSKESWKDSGCDFGSRFKNPKPKLIIFEGADKTGKTTLYQAYRRATEYKPLVIDRFIGSNIAHDISMKRYRISYNADLLAIECLLQDIFDVYLIILVCNIETLEARIESLEADQVDRQKAKEISSGVQEEFMRYFIESPIKKKTIIDTSHFNVGESLDRILEFTGEEYNK